MYNNIAILVILFLILKCLFSHSYLRHSQSVQVVHCLLKKYPQLMFNTNNEVALVSTLGKYSCMSSTFPIAILNGTCFFAKQDDPCLGPGFACQKL